MPDGDTSKVVVENIKESVTVTGNGVEGWTLHIFTLPQALPGFYSPGKGPYLATQYNDVATYSGAADYMLSGASHVLPTFVPVTYGGGTENDYERLGLVNIHQFNSSTQTVFAPNATAMYAKPSSTNVLGMPDNLNHGRRRCIALAFEIHDTTAEIYKQGTLTAYRTPQVPTESTYVLYDNIVGGHSNLYPCGGLIPRSEIMGYSTPLVGTPGFTRTVEFNTPPASVAEAMAYSGTRQWEAREGAYVVCQQDVTRNHLAFNSCSNTAFTCGDSDPIPPPQEQLGNTGIATAWHNRNTVVSTGLTAISDDAYDVMHPIATYSSTQGMQTFTVPFHTSGVYLTGLNAKSTFTITVRSTWEVAPVYGDANNASLVYLAHPSPEHDPLALELYQRTCVRMPVAVPVSFNAAGDLWDWTLTALAAAAPTVGSLLGAPGKAVGNMAKAGIEKYQKNRNEVNKDTAKAMKKLADMDITNFKSGAKPKVATKKHPVERKPKQKKPVGKKSLLHGTDKWE